jgi:hypothetical protein
MNIYKISQEINNDYDTYDSMIVAANTVKEASEIHPGNTSEEKIFLISKQFMFKSYTGKYFKYPYSDWVDNPNQVNVEYIGKAKKGTKQGIILASFNAG